MQTVKSRFESWLGGTSLCKGSQAYLCMKQHVYMAPCLNDVCRIMQCKQACNLLTPHKGSIPWKRGARTQACCLVGSRCSQLHLHLRSSAVKRRPGSHQRWCCEVTGPPAHPCAHAQALQPAHHCLHHSIATWIIRKGKERQGKARKGRLHLAAPVSWEARCYPRLPSAWVIKLPS